jgi:hypothetical protein
MGVTSLHLYCQYLSPLLTIRQLRRGCESRQRTASMTTSICLVIEQMLGSRSQRPSETMTCLTKQLSIQLEMTGWQNIQALLSSASMRKVGTQDTKFNIKGNLYNVSTSTTPCTMGSYIRWKQKVSNANNL